jgi:hypothetical protein
VNKRIVAINTSINKIDIGLNKKIQEIKKNRIPDNGK